MKSLPLLARLFVGAVIALGTGLFFSLFPFFHINQPTLLLVLVIVASVTSTFKVHLPLSKSGSTMSVSYAIDFTSLLLLGPTQTMLVGASSAFTQCTFKMREKNPLYRTLF